MRERELRRREGHEGRVLQMNSAELTPEEVGVFSRIDYFGGFSFSLQHFCHAAFLFRVAIVCPTYFRIASIYPYTSI